MDDNSILKLLKEKDRYEKQAKEYKETLEEILSSFYSIGAPLNDNLLGYSGKQLIIFTDIAKLIKYRL